MSHRDASIAKTQFRTHSDATHLPEHFTGKSIWGWLFRCTYVKEIFKSFKSIRLWNAGIKWCYVHSEQILGMKVRVLIDVFSEMRGYTGDLRSVFLQQLFNCTFVEEMFKSFKYIRMQVYSEQIFGLKVRVLIDVFNEIEGMSTIFYIGW